MELVEAPDSGDSRTRGRDLGLADGLPVDADMDTSDLTSGLTSWDVFKAVCEVRIEGEEAIGGP